MTDVGVEANYETMVEKQTQTENKIATLDYTGFMINKETQSKF